MTKDYRKKIYQNYASGFQNLSLQFDEKAAKRWSKTYEHYLKAWLPMNKDSKVLEIGCGGGKLLYFFKARGYKNLKGLDTSPEQVKISRQVIPNVVEADVLKFLKSKKGSYDLIVGLDIIEHFGKGECLNLLDLCHKALRPSGQLILQTVNADSPWCTASRYGDFTHEICLNAQSLSYLLFLSGFEEIECRESGPAPIGLFSVGRLVIWESIRMFLKLWNLAEMGHAGNGIFTRNFLVTARRTSGRS